MTAPFECACAKKKLLATHWHYIYRTSRVKFRTYTHLFQLIKEAVRNVPSVAVLFQLEADPLLKPGSMYHKGMLLWK